MERTSAETVYTGNYALIERALKLGKKVIGSTALNVFNSESVKFWADFGVGESFLSQELNTKQIEKIATLPESVYQIFTVPGTDKIFVTTVTRESNEVPDIYVMGTDGSNMKVLEIPEY